MDRKIEFMCPNCGWIFDAADRQYRDTTLVPYHDFPKMCRQICPGSKQDPRDIHDRRPLWKDELQSQPEGETEQPNQSVNNTDRK